MRKTANKKLLIVWITVLFFISIFCSGCGLMIAPIMGATLTGAGIGAIIGHQSGEALAGAVVGGAILGGFETAKQTDRLAKQEKCEQEKRQITVHTKEEDGSYKPVEFRKTKKEIYEGPDGKLYVRQKDGSFVPLKLTEQEQ